MLNLNKKQKLFFLTIISLFFILYILIDGYILNKNGIPSNFEFSNLSPSKLFLFGTDWLGRDMFSRTLAGLSISIQIGIFTAILSSIIAIFLGAISALGNPVLDNIISMLTNIILGIPHILLLILISFACGKGLIGIIVGISLTHWPTLSKVIRSEILSLKESGFILVSKKFGSSNFYLLKKHLLPNIFPQIFVGMLLIFPQAILHEASITFLGFGLDNNQPAIGIILSESLHYLTTGNWWLALFPGLFLIFIVLIFHFLGRTFSIFFNLDEEEILL